MRLTGAQVERIAEISDGAAVVLATPASGLHIIVEREEDGLRVEVGEHGNEVVFAHAKANDGPQSLKELLP